MGLSQLERQEFLAEPHIGSLAVEAGAARAPVVVPIWYDYRPGGVLRVITGTDSVKARLIGAAGRFSLLVERVRPTVRYVSVSGPVVTHRAAQPGEYAALTRRYLGDDEAERHLEEAQASIPRVVIEMEPTHWFAADMGPL